MLNSLLEKLNESYDSPSTTILMFSFEHSRSREHKWLLSQLAREKRKIRIRIQPIVLFIAKFSLDKFKFID